MKLSRRTFLKGLSGILAAPVLAKASLPEFPELAPEKRPKARPAMRRTRKGGAVVKYCPVETMDLWLDPPIKNLIWTQRGRRSGWKDHLLFHDMEHGKSFLAHGLMFDDGTVWASTPGDQALARSRWEAQF